MCTTLSLCPAVKMVPLPWGPVPHAHGPVLFSPAASNARLSCKRSSSFPWPVSLHFCARSRSSAVPGALGELTRSGFQKRPSPTSSQTPLPWCPPPFLSSPRAPRTHGVYVVVAGVASAVLICVLLVVVLLGPTVVARIAPLVAIRISLVWVPHERAVVLEVRAG